MSGPLLNLLFFLAVAVALWLGVRYGRTLLGSLRRNRAYATRVLREDLLKHILERRLDEGEAGARELRRALRISEKRFRAVVSDLEAHGMLTAELQLTETGQEYALRIMRAHRLYERYLAEETGYNEVEWHRRADDREHLLSEREVEELARKLGNPTYDPHGDPIPAQDGTVATRSDALPLSELEPRRDARILHVEDEPEALYRDLVAAGLACGQHVRLTARNDRELTVRCEGREATISVAAAGNVTVALVEKEADAPGLTGVPLSSVPPGRRVRVHSLSPRLRGSDRRRLLDLGLLPGTLIGVEFRSAGGDPVAYDIRGSLIALRRSQTDLIFVEAPAGSKDEGGGNVGTMEQTNTTE